MPTGPRDREERTGSTGFSSILPRGEVCSLTTERAGGWPFKNEAGEAFPSPRETPYSRERCPLDLSDHSRRTGVLSSRPKTRELR